MPAALDVRTVPLHSTLSVRNMLVKSNAGVTKSWPVRGACVRVNAALAACAGRTAGTRLVPGRILFVHGYFRLPSERSLGFASFPHLDCHLRIWVGSQQPHFS